MIFQSPIAYPETDVNSVQTRGERRLYAELLCTAYLDLQSGSYHETENAIWWFNNTSSEDVEFYGIAYHQVKSALNLRESHLKLIDKTVAEAMKRVAHLKMLPLSERSKKNKLPLNATLSKNGKITGPRYRRPSTRN